MEKSLYYNPNKLLSYNRILNFCIGARGIGKSYAWKVHPIKRFLKYGEQFIYLRRYKPELKKVNQYFDNIVDEFPGHELKVKGRQFFVDGKLAGWAIPLSSWQSEKSNAYPNVSTIVFDEFLREKDNSGYLPNEVSATLNLMDTVFRDRENCRLVALSNAVSIVNPYFLYFNLIPNINRRFNANESIVVEIPDSKDFANERKKTRFGKLINGTDYGDMSLNNDFVNDSQVFIERRSKESKFVFTVIFKGFKLGVWVDNDLGLLFMSQDHDPSTKNVYVFSKDELTENAMLVQGWKNHYMLRKLMASFMSGYLRFDSQVIRNIGYELFNKMNLK